MSTSAHLSSSSTLQEIDVLCSPRGYRPQEASSAAFSPALDDVTCGHSVLTLVHFLWASAPFPTSHLPKYRDLKLSATLPAPITHTPSPWEVTWRPRWCSTLSSCTLFWGSAHLFPTSTPPPSPSPHKWINSYPQTSLKIPSPGCRLFSQGPDQKRPRAACAEGGTFILMHSLEFTMQERWGRQHVLFTINTSRP